MKPRNPAQAPRQAAGDAQTSPEAESCASGPDLQQEAALLAIFRHLSPAGRHKLMRRAKQLREEDIQRLVFLLRK